MAKKIAILVKNYSSKPRDVGDINGMALFNQLKHSDIDVNLIYLNGKTTSQKNLVSFWKALTRKYDVVYASSPKRYYGVACIFFALVHLKPLHFSVFDSSLEPITKTRLGILFFKTLCNLGIIRPFSVSEHQKIMYDKYVGLKLPILYPCLLAFGYNKKYKKNRFPTVLFCGSTNNKKRGLVTLLNACELVSKENPKIKLVLLNKFNSYERWNKINIRQRKYNFEIIQKGYVKNIDNEYKKAWVYVLPFKRMKYVPPIPFTMLEALSFGCSVISSKYPHFKELLSEQFLINHKSKKDLAQLIERVIKNRKPKAIDKKYFPENVAKKFLKLTNYAS